MTCQELVEFLMGYLDGELPEAQNRAFEEHLDECPDCVAYLETYQEAVRLAREVCRGEESVPDEVPEELVKAILDSRKR